MANDNTQARPNFAPQIQERSLRIDGERTAAMYALAIRVSRLDNRLRDLAGSTSVEGRKQYLQASESFTRYLGAFADGLALVEKDADMNSRRGPRGQSKQPRRQPPQQAQGSQENGQKPAPKAAPAAATTQPAANTPAESVAPAAIPKAVDGQKQPQKPAPQTQKPNGQQSKGQQPKGNGNKNSNAGGNKGQQQPAKPQQQPKQQQSAPAAPL